MSNPFAGIDQEQLQTRNYLPPGFMFGLEVVRCYQKQTRDKGPAVICDFIVTHSNCPAKPVGSPATWYLGLATGGFTRPGDGNIAFRNLKNFIASCLGFQQGTETWTRFETEVNPRLADLTLAATDARNILAGLFVAVETEAIVTKKKGSDFTVHKWFPAFVDKAGQAVAPLAGWGIASQRFAAQPSPIALPPDPFLQGRAPAAAPPTAPWMAPQGVPIAPTFAQPPMMQPVPAIPVFAPAPAPAVPQYPGYTWNGQQYVPNGT